MIWLFQNWQGVLTVLSTLLSAGVSIAHLAHKQAVASQLEEIQNTIALLAKKK